LGELTFAPVSNEPGCPALSAYKPTLTAVAALPESRYRDSEPTLPDAVATYWKASADPGASLSVPVCTALLPTRTDAADGVGVGDTVGNGVAVGVGEGRGVAEAVDDGVAVGVAVGAGDGVGDDPIALIPMSVPSLALRWPGEVEVRR
jgi:hypothetical protein